MAPISMNDKTMLIKSYYPYHPFKVFWSSQNGSFVLDQIFVYGTLMGVDYKSEKKIYGYGPRFWVPAHLKRSFLHTFTIGLYRENDQFYPILHLEIKTVRLFWTIFL